MKTGEASQALLLTWEGFKHVITELIDVEFLHHYYYEGALSVGKLLQNRNDCISDQAENKSKQITCTRITLGGK